MRVLFDTHKITVHLYKVHIMFIIIPLFTNNAILSIKILFILYISYINLYFLQIPFFYLKNTK